MPHVDLETPVTWPRQFRMLANTVAAQVQGSTTYPSDIRIDDPAHEELDALLTNHRVRTYHATRLLDVEVDDIILHGLRAATDSLLRDKLDRAVHAFSLTEAEADRLAADSPLPRQRPGREDGYAACTTRRTLDEEADGLHPLLTHWGGEIIYFWQRDPALCAKLRTIGRPAIVVADLPYDPSDVWSPTVPQLAVSRVLALDGLTGGVHHRAIPGERLRVAEVWQPGHPDYDRHRGLPPA